MSLQSATKTSSMERQSRMFIDSLYKELDKLSAKADSRNSSLMKRASCLLSDGFSEDSCVEMLIMEGYSDFQSRQCVESVSFTKTASSNSVSQFDYCFEDHRGRMFTGRELNNLVESENEEEAKKSVKEILASFDPPVKLISITKLS